MRERVELPAAAPTAPTAGGRLRAAPLLARHLALALLALLVLLALSGSVGAFTDYNLAAIAYYAIAAAGLALAVALPEVATRYASVFGGNQGLTVAPLTHPGWLGADFPDERWLACVSF